MESSVVAKLPGLMLLVGSILSERWNWYAGGGEGRKSVSML
jgi:hypothetical protein